MAAYSGMCAFRRSILGKCQRNTQTIKSLFTRPNSPSFVPSIHRPSMFLSSYMSHRHHKSATPQMTFTIINPLAVHNCSSYSQQASGTTENLLGSRQPPPPDGKDKTNSGENKEKGGEEKKNTFMKKYGVWIGLASITSSLMILGGHLYLKVWGPPLKDPDGKEIPDEFSHLPWYKAYWERTIREAHFFKKMIEEPSSQKLLPDPLQEPWYQPPYTLVLELTGVLVHPDWTFSTGWRFKKRPAVEYFLQQVGPPMFEVVIYTREQGFTAFPIIDGLDPNGYVSFRLFRDATRYIDGTHVKDLDCLNRDLSKVIVVDCDPKAVKLHSRNAVPLKKWTGDDEDRTLVDLAQFLRTLGTSGVEDVRPVLDHYNQTGDPIEAFKENQRRLQEELAAQEAMKSKEKERKSPLSSWSMGLTGRRG